MPIVHALAFYLIWFGASCAIGALIGRIKHRTGMGAALGVFGPIGWLVIAVVPTRSH